MTKKEEATQTATGCHPEGPSKALVGSLFGDLTRSRWWMRPRKRDLSRAFKMTRGGVAQGGKKRGRQHKPPLVVILKGLLRSWWDLSLGMKREQVGDARSKERSFAFAQDDKRGCDNGRPILSS